MSSGAPCMYVCNKDALKKCQKIKNKNKNKKREREKEARVGWVIIGVVV